MLLLNGTILLGPLYLENGTMGLVQELLIKIDLLLRCIKEKFCLSGQSNIVNMKYSRFVKACV